MPTIWSMWTRWIHGLFLQRYLGFFLFFCSLFFYKEEEFEDTKGVIRIRKSKDRQHNDTVNLLISPNIIIFSYNIQNSQIHHICRCDTIFFLHHKSVKSDALNRNIKLFTTKNSSWNILTWYHILLDTMYRLLVVKHFKHFTF
jgi:hypothetical protein